MRSKHFFRRLFRLPAWKLKLLLEAAYWLLLARVALLVLPFNRIGRYLGTLQKPLAHDASTDAERAALAVRIGRAVDAAADHSPLPLVCLPRALAGWQMLHRREIASRLHFGAMRRTPERQEMLTHAWVSSYGVEVTGYPVAYECVELGFYARDVQPEPDKAPATARTQ